MGQLWGDFKPPAYKKGDKLDVEVGELWSAAHPGVPYDFYTLNWCSSTSGHVYDRDSFNSGGKGHDKAYANEQKHASPYTFTVGEPEGYKVVCNKILSLEEQQQFIFMIQNWYRYQLHIDDLPNSLINKDEQTGERVVDFRDGIPVGEFFTDGPVRIFNHLSFTVRVNHVSGGDEMRIVGFEVEPMSIARGSRLSLETLA